MGTLPDAASWPYLATLLRLALALGLGLFIGLERERRGKEAGVRTFALVSTLGCAGGLLGDGYAYWSIALMVPFVVFLNLHCRWRSHRRHHERRRRNSDHRQSCQELRPDSARRLWDRCSSFGGSSRSLSRAHCGFVG